MHLERIIAQLGLGDGLETLTAYREIAVSLHPPGVSVRESEGVSELVCKREGRRERYRMQSRCEA
jgi:hypothetical protein